MWRKCKISHGIAEWMRLNMRRWTWNDFRGGAPLLRWFSAFGCQWTLSIFGQVWSLTRWQCCWESGGWKLLELLHSWFWIVGLPTPNFSGLSPSQLASCQVRKMLGLVLFLIGVGIGWGHDCSSIRPILLCNDLCSESLDHPRVHEVRFAGVLASFSCVPASIKVSRKFDSNIWEKHIGVASKKFCSRTRKCKGLHVPLK